MKRKDFIKRLAIGSILLPVLPSVVNAVVREETWQDILKKGIDAIGRDVVIASSETGYSSKCIIPKEPIDTYIERCAEHVIKEMNKEITIEAHSVMNNYK